MTGRHEGPPLGSAARDATAPPYHGKRRADEAGWLHLPRPPVIELSPGAWMLIDRIMADDTEPPDDPARCWSCGHPWDAGCECACCGDNDPHGEWNPDA